MNIFDIMEAIKKQDSKNLVNKIDDAEDIVKQLKNNPQAYIKKKLAKHGSLEALITKYMKLKGISNTDIDLQLLATAISQIVKKVEEN